MLCCSLDCLEAAVLPIRHRTQQRPGVLTCTPDGRRGCNLPTSLQIAPLDNPASCMHNNISAIGSLSSEMEQGSFLHLMSMPLIQRTRHRSRGPRRCCAQGRPGGMAASDLRVHWLSPVCWPGLSQQHCTRLICLCLHYPRVLPAAALSCLAAAQQVSTKPGFLALGCIAV